jgi:hypothetical protein
MSEHKAMADQKLAQHVPQAKKEPGPEPVALGDAGASANPVVQQLLAHRQIAVSNGDEDAIAAVDGQLAELGVG